MNWGNPRNHYVLPNPTLNTNLLGLQTPVPNNTTSAIKAHNMRRANYERIITGWGNLRLSLAN
jgi:hypothetical protein